MGATYAVTIERIEGARIEMRVRTVSPDAGPPPAAATFPMNLLLDLWGLLHEGDASLIEGADLSDEDGIALAAREPWAATMRRLHALSRGVDEPITEEELAELEATMPRMFRGRLLAAFGRMDGVLVATLVEGPEALEAAVAPLVREYRQDEHENEDVYAAWAGESDADEIESGEPEDERLPSVRLIVTLEDAALLGFARSGWSFESTAWC